jgi:hypothetical protein
MSYLNSHAQFLLERKKLLSGGLTAVCVAESGVSLSERQRGEKALKDVKQKR